MGWMDVYTDSGDAICQNHFSNFGKGLQEEHLYEIILILGHWPRRRYCLKIFTLLALVAILSNDAELFEQF